MDLVSVPGVAGPNLAAPRITFSYAPVNMQALPDGTHVGRDAGHAGHSHGHAHAAHGHGHGHSHGTHGHGHAHTPSQIQMQPGPAAMPSHQTHAHQPPAAGAAHSHSHGQDHTSAASSGELSLIWCVCLGRSSYRGRVSRDDKPRFALFLSSFYGMEDESCGVQDYYIWVLNLYVCSQQRGSGIDAGLASKLFCWCCVAAAAVL